MSRREFGSRRTGARASVGRAPGGWELRVRDAYGELVHVERRATEAAAVEAMRGLPWGPWREVVDAREGV